MARTRNLKRKTYKRKSSKRRVSRRKASRRIKRGGLPPSYQEGTKLKCCLVPRTYNKDPLTCLADSRTLPAISRNVIGEFSNISEDGQNITLSNSKFQAPKYTEMYPDKMVTVDESTCQLYSPILQSKASSSFKYYLFDKIAKQFSKIGTKGVNNKDITQVSLKITNTPSTDSKNIYTETLKTYVDNNQIPEEVITSVDSTIFENFIDSLTDPLFVNLQQLIIEKTQERANIIEQELEAERLQEEERERIEKAKYSNRFKAALGFR
jgi:hypothetical protein